MDVLGDEAGFISAAQIINDNDMHPLSFKFPSG